MNRARTLASLIVAVGLGATMVFAAAAQKQGADTGTRAVQAQDVDTSAVQTGKDEFNDKKCITCHTVTAEGIGDANAKKKGGDLSQVGAKHDADWIAQYISKQTELNGKKHVATWKGEAAELQVLTKWLATLGDTTEAKE